MHIMSPCLSFYIIDLVLSGEGHPFHPFVPSSKFLIPGWRRWWNGRRATTHGDGRSLSTWSCDPVSAVCLSTAKLFLCGLQEFSRASDGRPATIETSSFCCTSSLLALTCGVGAEGGFCISYRLFSNISHPSSSTGAPRSDCAIALQADEEANHDHYSPLSDVYACILHLSS
jgi:hypothetical protein